MNFSSQVEHLRSEITSSFSELIKLLQERRDLLLRQLDSLSIIPQIFPQPSNSEEVKKSPLSDSGMLGNVTPQQLCELKFNLDPNLTACLHNIGLIQVCWSGEKLFVLDYGNKRVDVFDKEGELQSSFLLRIEIASNELICFAASIDYLLLTRQSSDIVTYYTHNGTLLPGLPYHLEDPVSMAACREMVAIVDKSSHHVLLFPQFSDRVTMIGSESTRPGQLYKPEDVAFTPDNCLLVLDHKNPCLHLYDMKGHYLTSFGCSLVGFDITHPSCFSIDHQGVVLLVHKRSKKVTIFNPNRTLAYKLRVQPDASLSIHGYLFPSSCALQRDLLAVAYEDNNIVGICNTASFKKISSLINLQLTSSGPKSLFTHSILYSKAMIVN
ncbi:hypothetical protein LOD99_8264 [Oopsacas minuta]|uniref:Uncharacterized protein n=1 Tax=Oopsacas minuta TaxID=111878 RepID=A0AAV7JGQ3_9METZ|nr:hypothetical protein LOD99_8264 [Oopsacas minuta]